VDAEEMTDVYERVKRQGRLGVDHVVWSKGVKVVGSLTPLEVTDFQQFYLSPNEEARAYVFGEPETGRRR
jgi:hypothetical protein